MNRNRAKKYLRKRGRLNLLEEIEIQQGKDGEPRYILTQKHKQKNTSLL